MPRFQSKSARWTTCAVFACIAWSMARGVLHLSAAASDVVLYASDVTNIQGNWAKWSGSDAAGGQYMASVDYGWGALNAPLSSPNDYFEASFNADASTPFHVWLRLRAGSLHERPSCRTRCRIERGALRNDGGARRRTRRSRPQ